MQSIDVVRQFVKFELQGGRLTATGWRNAGNRFFVKPEPDSTKKEIRVVADNFYVRLSTLTETPTATVEASFPVCWGKIDSRLHFHFTGEGIPPGIEVLAGCWETYKLIYSFQRWNVGSDGKVTPFTGSTNLLRMKIDNFPQHLILDRNAAIRYVTEMRDKSNDPLVKKNADKTLAALSKLKE